jgi:cytochrome c-type biogenesis protein CcmH/NrfF
MSPFCPGRTLAACTSGQATELRQWILLQEAAGASREEVVGILEQRFGDVIRSRPEARGWGLAAWLLPAAAAILGGGVVAFALRRVVVKPVASAPAGDGDAAAAASEDLEFERLVDEELAARDS